MVRIWTLTKHEKGCVSKRDHVLDHVWNGVFIAKHLGSDSNIYWLLGLCLSRKGVVEFKTKIS